MPDTTTEEHEVSNARYQALFQYSLSGVAYCHMIYENGVASDFTYLEVNPAFERLSGLRNVTGKRFTEVLPGVRESNPEILATYDRVVASGTPEHFESFSTAFGGWLSVTAYRPEPGHFAAVFENITEQKKMGEVERLNKLLVGRELKMLELKEENAKLAKELGREPSAE